MQIIRVHSKNELSKNINNISCSDGDIYINIRPTLDIVEKLIEKCPDVQTLTCPPSLYLQTSKKVFKRLEEASVAFKGGDFAVGRPKKYDEETIREISEQRQAGKPVKQIAQDMNIPLRTVYFYLRGD